MNRTWDGKLRTHACCGALNRGHALTIMKSVTEPLVTIIVSTATFVETIALSAPVSVVTIVQSVAVTSRTCGYPQAADRLETWRIPKRNCDSGLSCMKLREGNTKLHR